MPAQHFSVHKLARCMAVDAAQCAWSSPRLALARHAVMPCCIAFARTLTAGAAGTAGEWVMSCRYEPLPVSCPQSLSIVGRATCSHYLGGLEELFAIAMAGSISRF